jgi:uncharacterized membrane protein (UPF0127 family)
MGTRDRGCVVKSLKNQALVADKCLVAESFLTRLKGLIGRRALAPGEAMLFPRCNSVHMWFMRFAIDVVFLREERGEGGVSLLRITSVRAARPWRPLPLADWKATHALELPRGAAERAGLRAGDALCTS